jgi:alpha-tubulin suppressor-like RCC1 family protein
LTNVIAIAAGRYHSLALKPDGTVAAWGLYGQTNVPAGLTNVITIAAGGHHNLALKQDGTVVAWGGNGYGQTNVPVGLTNVIAIAAGSYHSLALKPDGTIALWGANSRGQTNMPAGLNNVIAIAAGGSHSLSVFRPPSLLVSPRIADQGTFECALMGIAGGNYVIQISSNLNQWTDWRSITAAASAVVFEDLSATNARSRFYRAVQTP